MHLTLKFLGNLEAGQPPVLAAALQEHVHGLKPLRLSARGWGCFPSPQRPSVIWAGLAGELDALRALQAVVERACAGFGSHSEDRAFHPHLTIGRVKAFGPAGRRIGERVRSEPSDDLGEWEVDRISLIRSRLSSQGSIYSSLAEIALTGR